MNSSPDLTALRSAIEQTDRQILALFEQRMRIASQVGALKLASGRPVYDAVREAELVAGVTAEVAPEHRQRALNMMSCLMRQSRGVQYEMIARESDHLIEPLTGHAQAQWPQDLHVLCQGAEGAYSAEAARVLFPDHAFTMTETWADACEQVSDGRADVVVLPLENSSAGTVGDVYDLILRHDLKIWRSLRLPIRHVLMGNANAGRHTVHTVISHPQALAQCSDMIRAAGWKTRESLNTAYAARTVAESQDPGLAAIGSRAAADAWGLRIIDRDLSNQADNQTRFIAVGRDMVTTPDASQISLILRLPHQSGSLASTLAIFADRGLNLTRIQSRPDPDQPWAYMFYLDFTAARDDWAAVQAVLYQLESEMPLLRYLGWYHEQRVD